MGRTFSDRTVLVVAIAGAIVAATGAGVYVHRRRSQRLLDGAFGRAEVQRHAPDRAGMRVTHYRDKLRLPIEDRIRIIQKVIWDGINGPDMPELRALALSITRDCPERDGRCEARAIYDYVKQHVRYTGDIAPIKMPDADGNGPVEAIDLFQSARRTVEKFHGGDCDDHAILVATLLTLNGITAQLRITAPRPGSDWSHIYAIAGINSKMAPKQWIALDTTLPGINWFAKEVTYAKKRDFKAPRYPGAVKRRAGETPKYHADYPA